MKYTGFITEIGILLDDFFNEIRDEEGCIVVIPQNQRWTYKTITKEERGVY